MLRIANASGFWGDQPGAAAHLVAAQPDLDYLTLDYLAEVSLSIMAIQREKDPAAGFACDFVDVVASLVPFWKGGGRTRIVTKGGGIDPLACAQACREVLKQGGLGRLKLAVVTGDDVLAVLRGSEAGRVDGAARPVLSEARGETPRPHSNLETAEPLSAILSRLVTANAYLGAGSIAEALKAGADIVITGRCADPSLTVGPCLAHFDWKESTPRFLGRLADATVAGHLIECGTQACGGFSTDWLNLPDPGNIGFPIAEISADGSCVITKPPGTGGAVTVQTVKEQLLYEIGDPGAYLSPDVTASLLTLRVEQLAANRVRVSGAVGRAPTSSYKVSATYRDGYRAHGMITVYGRDAVKKARRAGEELLGRLRAAGCVYRETLIECLGSGASVAGIGTRVDESTLVETVLRVSVSAADRSPVERFTKELAPLVTCGPQGITGYASGRPRVLPVFGYWPCLIEKSLVKAAVHVLK